MIQKAQKRNKESQLNEFLFKDPALVFQALWRFGVIATGAGDLGESLTAISQIRDCKHEDWYDAWISLAERVENQAKNFLRKGHRISAQEAFFRATNYYRSAEIYLEPTSSLLIDCWTKGRNTFLEAVKLSDDLIKFMKIPYENTTLPAYYCRVDNSTKKRSLLIIQTGLDGTVEDLYFIIVVNALKRGFNCLIFEGPGQGEMIRIKKLPFRHDWEKVITPVVDFSYNLPETDLSKIILLGYSMGGYLAPRALAFESRIKYGIADGGVFSVFDGLMTKFPSIIEMLDNNTEEEKINNIVTTTMSEQSDINKFMIQMLWTFQANTPFQLFQKLKKFNQKDTIDKITCEMLVVNSIDDQVAGSFEQSKIFYEKLNTKKTYMEFSRENGGQFHCQLGAPMFSGEKILNWLEERL